MELSPDGKFIFLLADGKPPKVDVGGGQERAASRSSGEMVLQGGRGAELHLRPRLAAVQGEVLRRGPAGRGLGLLLQRTYRKFLPFINNNYDFAEMLSEMLGEVNASHTGCYVRRRAAERRSDSGARAPLRLGAIAGDGVKIAEVVEGGPLDKARARRSRPGTIIEKIDGEPVDAADSTSISC